MSLLEVNGLSVSMAHRRRQTQVVDNISFSVDTQETLCIVGESGSGKSMTAKALISLLPKHATASGQVAFNGQPLLGNNAESIRGRDIGMIFQEPMTALNPVLSIGRQMTEAAVVIGGLSQSKANTRATELLDKVGIDGGAGRLSQYPHELSGGMRQRVLIAMAMMLSPKLLIADEPTTALDVTIQAQILTLLKQLVADTGMGLLFITHDMGVVAQMADRVLVMKDGQAIETAPVKQLFAAPQQSYTKALLAAVPRIDDAGQGQPTQSGTSVLELQQVSKQFRSTARRLFTKRSSTQALERVDLTLHQGEVLAIVGESGSGKSTLGRAVTRLESIDGGSIEVNGINISRLRGAALRTARAGTQMIFQDPYSSLDPRFTVARTIAEPMIIHGKSKADARNRTNELLEQVGLGRDAGGRYPHEFSGGQRQRIAIARALATDPGILVADEPTSALDVSVQAQILELLSQLKAQRNLSMLFISHDLAVVNQIADRVAVMQKGRIVEIGYTQQVLKNPQQAYTQELIQSAPIPDPNRRQGRLSVS